MAGDLSGRVAVVTGGGRGIGAAIAAGLARAGAAVAITGRQGAALDATARTLAAAGAKVAAVVCDVAKADDVIRAAEAVRRALGPVTIVINNAGVARSAKLADTDEALWAEALDVNLTGAYRVTRAFGPDVLAAGARGRVIHIASVAAKVGFAYTTAYCASKHGLLGFTRALALEWAARGPTVNCVCPGWVDTDMSAEAIARIAVKTGRDAGAARREARGLQPAEAAHDRRGDRGGDRVPGHRRRRRRHRPGLERRRRGGHVLMSGIPIQPPGWVAPRGYANGMRARGELLAVAGQIAWDAQARLVPGDFAAQFEQALSNVVAVVRAGGGEADDLISLTIYVTDRAEYLAHIKEVGAAYRRVVGKHYPAMALVQVAGLLEVGAKVEIQGLAVVDHIMDSTGD